MGGSAYVIKDWIDLADAVVMSFYSGLEGGNALADIISGDVTPAGKLPFTIANKAEDYPPFLHLGAKDKNIEYGYYHGYTLFDKKGIEAHFPFGFGLSYTEFEIGTPVCEKVNDVIKVKATVKNIGKVDGDEVLQVYIGSDNKDIDRPIKVLKGFKRVSVKAGEALTAEIDVLIDDIKFYNPENGNWKLDESYTVYVGTDSKNVTAIGKISF